MSSANVIPFRSRDPVRSRDPLLEEEVRTAADIVRRIRVGDTDAETEMVERYGKGLRYLLARRIGDDERARDLLQETFCIAIEKLRNTEIENPERLAGYLRGIAIRVALNAGRRQKRLSYGLDIEALERIPDSEPRVFQNLAAEQTTAAVRMLLDSMPIKRDRELLLRFYVYDQDKQEICRALGLDSLHFNRVLYRAKSRFRKILEDAGDWAELGPQ